MRIGAVVTLHQPRSVLSACGGFQSVLDQLADVVLNFEEARIGWRFSRQLLVLSVIVLEPRP